MRTTYHNLYIYIWYFLKVVIFKTLNNTNIDLFDTVIILMD